MKLDGRAERRSPADIVAMWAESDRFGLLALGVYVALSCVLFGRSLLGGFRTRLVGGIDPEFYMWCLVWWPHAFANHLNPFLCRSLWAPGGVNLAWVPSIPFLSIVASPVTVMLGPVAASNVLFLLAPAIDAYAAFLLCREVSRRYAPALLGGYLFGFSPYVAAHIVHLNFSPVFAVPIAVYLVMLLIRGRLGRVAFVTLMAVNVAVQFGISTEVFAPATVFGAIAIGVALVTAGGEARAELGRTVLPILASYAFAAIALAPYLYYIFAYGPPSASFPSPSRFSSDLLNFLVPTSSTLIGTNRVLSAVSPRFAGEATAYVALPVLAVATLHCWRRRETFQVRYLAILLAIVWLASLGPRLHLAGHQFFVLPWKLTSHLPLIRYALPARFSMYGFLILAIMTALWFAEARAGRIALGAIAAAIVLFTLPRAGPSHPVDTPTFFSRGDYRRYLTQNENVLIIPYGSRGSSMLWQAEAHMFFRMAGGYTGPTPKDFADWPVVGSLLNDSYLPDALDQLNAFLMAHEVRTVLVAQAQRTGWDKLLSLESKDPIEVGGVRLYRIADNALASFRNTSAIDMKRKFELTRLESLLVAADQYISAGGDLDSLSPSKAEEMGLLPHNFAFDEELYAPDRLTLRRWNGATVALGLQDRYEALTPVIERYGPDAREAFFPFPHRLGQLSAAHGSAGRLVMVFDRRALARAAARATPHPRAASGPARPSDRLDSEQSSQRH